MPVNETLNRHRHRRGLRAAIADRVLRRSTLVWLATAVALVLMFHYLVMPWAVRGRVRAALDEAGLRKATFRVTRATLWTTDVRDIVIDPRNRIDRMLVRYNVQDLWEREVEEITVFGATLAADPRHWPIQKKRRSPRAPAPATLPKAAPLILPFRRLAVQGSTLVLADGSKIPFDATLLRGPLELAYRAGSLEQGLEVSGTVARAFTAGRVNVYVKHAQGEAVTALLRTFVKQVPLAIRGRIGGEGKAAWDEHGTRVTAALEIAGGSIDQASDTKLTLAAGVFVGEANIGPATRPTVAVKLRDADLATPDLQATGVSGAVTLIDLSPPTSAPDQRLSAQTLKIGDTEFANGQIEFEVNAGGDIFVEQTRWDFLGGQVYANDVQVPRDGPVSMTLRADNVELRDILEMYAKDKLAGTGRISGYLPVVIDGSNITFGDGQLKSLAGGQLRIEDRETLQQVTQMAGAAASGSPEQVKQNIAEALKDFEYDRMTARLVNEPDGLVAYVNIEGHGRTGARQEIEYEPRIRGLDDVLRLYLDMQEALNRPAASRPSATTSATTGKVESR